MSNVHIIGYIQNGKRQGHLEFMPARQNREKKIKGINKMYPLQKYLY